MQDNPSDLIKYLRGIGLEVNTNTRARGNQGFYLKNRIDISKNIPLERVIPVLIHEFAHYIHSKIEPDIDKTGGTIEKIFDDDRKDFYEQELEAVTKFVDNNSKCEKLIYHKTLIKEKIKEYELIIKSRYPQFQRSKKFKEFERYIKNSNAKYLLKYDRVKLITRGVSRKTEILNIDSIENDFCDMPPEFAAYIRLHSCQKRQARVSAKINRLKKYYSKPTELFARFVQGLNIDAEKIREIAPNCSKRFFELLNCGYYMDLSGIANYLGN